MDKKLQSKDGHYLFNVDILISANTDPLALQYLLELMNGSKVVTDFKINSELPLGKTIDGLLKARIAQSRLENVTKEGKNTDAVKQAAPQPAAPAASGTGRPARPKQQLSLPEDAFGQIRTFIQENRLVRLIANRQGKQVSLPCRILNFDETAGTLNVYHVDEKQVYMFNLNEIDEFM